MGEFRQIIKDALITHSYDSTLFDGTTSEARQDLLAKEIEDKIKAKFHIFRINKIITGDSPSPTNINK